MVLSIMQYMFHFLFANLTTGIDRKEFWGNPSSSNSLHSKSLEYNRTYAAMIEGKVCYIVPFTTESTIACMCHTVSIGLHVHAHLLAMVRSSQVGISVSGA